MSQSVLIAQDTAERVKQAANERSQNILKQAEQDAQRLLDEAKYKANEILRQATDNAKKVAVETEELKNKSRVFHQRLKSTIESQLAIVDSSDWEGKFCVRQRLTFKQVTKLLKKLSEKFWVRSVTGYHDENPIDMTRQFSPEEVAELQARIEAANRELAESQKETKPDTASSVVEEVVSSNQNSQPTPLTESIDLL